MTRECGGGNGDYNGLDKPREECNHKELYPDLDVSKPLSVYFSVSPSAEPTSDLNMMNGNMNGGGSGVTKKRENGKHAAGKFRTFEPQRPNDEIYYVDRAMAAVGYVQSDLFELPESYVRSFVSQNDPALGNYSFGNDKDVNESSPAPGITNNNKHSNKGSRKRNQNGRSIRVEYDMDEQDEKFLAMLNDRRTNSTEPLNEVSKEIFEITMTLLETEWFILERRMPPKHKSLQDQSANTSSNITEEQCCLICDESECDNSNAIVFCDGCDIAVHQECYGVPFIPEGQWLCNKCRISPKHQVSCVFCPNGNLFGALKPTDIGNTWAHALCALWIPEVTVKHHIYMEPVTGLSRVPKGRWRLCCYICKCRMGACIQCANKNCFQAFHPTCARRASLYMKMSFGAYGALSDPGTLIAYCDNHTPLEYQEKIGDIKNAVKAAQNYYSRNVDRRGYTGNEWEKLFTSQCTVQPRIKYVRKRSDAYPRPWRTEKGTPVVPAVIVEKLHSVMTKFHIMKLREYIQQVSRYWALKRQLKRGAALSKRLQLALEVDPNQKLSETEAASKLEYYEGLLKNLESLRVLTDQVRQREELKFNCVEQQNQITELVYFPTIYFIRPIWQRILAFEKTHPNIFDLSTKEGIDRKVAKYGYRTIGSFASDFEDLCDQGTTDYAQKPLNRLRRMITPLLEHAQIQMNSLPVDEYTGLPDFKNFSPDGLKIHDEVWTGARLRREMSPLTDLEDSEMDSLENKSSTQRKYKKRKRDQQPLRSSARLKGLRTTT